jgi:hypothetical protein
MLLGRGRNQIRLGKSAGLNVGIDATEEIREVLCRTVGQAFHSPVEAVMDEFNRNSYLEVTHLLSEN